MGRWIKTLGVSGLFALVACAQILGLSDFEEGPYPPDAKADAPTADADAGDADAAIDPCSDGKMNGQETDIDCGGNCGKCVKGQKCKMDGDCAKTCSAGICVGCEGVELPDAGGACVDPREVTVAEYQDFRMKVPEGYGRGDLAFGCPGNVVHPSNLDQQLANMAFPVRNVLWCSARAFCKYRGKRLCGRFDGRSVDGADYKSPAVDQWTAACTVQGQHLYPYGDVFESSRCNDEGTMGGPWNAGSGTDCKTLGIALYDMSGNVAEWEDSCLDGGRDVRDGGPMCRVRGGSFASTSANVTCAADAVMDSKTENPQVGFRCCE